MSTHNICFHGEIRKNNNILVDKHVLPRAVAYKYTFYIGVLT